MPVRSAIGNFKMENGARTTPIIRTVCGWHIIFLYNRIDDERTVVYLFQEELKDRETNSFQGLGVHCVF